MVGNLVLGDINATATAPATGSPSAIYPAFPYLVTDYDVVRYAAAGDYISAYLKPIFAPGRGACTDTAVMLVLPDYQPG